MPTRAGLRRVTVTCRAMIGAGRGCPLTFSRTQRPGRKPAHYPHPPRGSVSTGATAWPQDGTSCHDSPLLPGHQRAGACKHLHVSFVHQFSPRQDGRRAPGRPWPWRKLSGKNEKAGDEETPSEGLAPTCRSVYTARPEAGHPTFLSQSPVCQPPCTSKSAGQLQT